MVEAIATITLIQVSEIQSIALLLVWFVVLFPTLVALLFFGTLWWGHQFLYSPMEFRSDESFLSAMTRLNRVEEDTAEARRVAVVARGESQIALDAARNLGPNQELDETAKNVLKALVEVPEVPTSIAEIAKLVNLDTADVSHVLEDMKDDGFVRQDVQGEQDEETLSWRLRGWGQIRVRQEIGLSKEDVRVLGGIKDSPEKRPTAKALAERLSLPQSATDRALNRLERFGLIAQSKSQDGGWRMRSWGKSVLQKARNK